MPDTCRTPEVSIIIINWNTADLVIACLRSLSEMKSAINYEVLIVDNHSTDGSLDMIIREFPDIRFVKTDENLGFGGGNNVGVSAINTENLLLLNSDTIVNPGLLEKILDVIRRNDRIGLVGARLLNQDGSFQASYTPFPTLWREFLILTKLGNLLHGKSYPSRGPCLGAPIQINGYVEGACMFIRKSAYQQIHGFDTDFFMYAEDVDLCYRLREAGWEIWYQPNASLIHLGGGSSVTRKIQRETDLYCSRVRFFKKHYGSFLASCLMIMIFMITSIKWISFSTIHLLGLKKYGRKIVSPDELFSALRGI